MTRFGKILPLWRNFKSLWLFFEGLFCIGQNFDPNRINVFDIGQIYIVVNGQILKILFSHLVTLFSPESTVLLEPPAILIRSLSSTLFGSEQAIVLRLFNTH